MMWNIENFTINKYNNNKWDNAHRRWGHILDTIQRVNPDIFVLIEVESGGAQEGTICGGTSAQGVLRLLQDLQAHPNNNFNTFRVVPPIVSGSGGMREGIAVFFKSTNLRFTGPFVWDGNAASPPVLRAGPVAAQAYAGVWANALPAANNQNQMAGQFRFSRTPRAPAPRRTVLAQFPGATNRSLYLTTFIDTTGGGNRLISLFAIHAPPQTNLATLVAGRLADLRDINIAPANNEVKLLVGDFNLNVIDANQRAAFAALVNLGYTRHNTNTPTSLKSVGAKTRFLVGKIYKNAARIVAKANEPPLALPYYGYIATAQYDAGTQLALDNILTRYGAGAAAGGPAANFHVVNRAYQMPANGYPPDLGQMPDPAAPANNVNATIPLMRTRYNIGGVNPQVGSANSYFRNYTRFGKIGASRGASDHMALVIDV
jgi:hypothetical protein